MPSRTHQDASDTKNAFTHAANMLKELKTTQLSPRNYYELYMKVHLPPDGLLGRVVRRAPHTKLGFHVLLDTPVERTTLVKKQNI